MQCRVQPCTCSPQVDHQCHESKPLNSARLSLHSLHFVTLSFRSVGSAVQRKRNQVGASLRSRSLWARMPTDDDLHCPQPLTAHHAMPAFYMRSSTCAGRTRFISPLLHEATRSGYRTCRAPYQRTISRERKAPLSTRSLWFSVAGQWQTYSFGARQSAALFHLLKTDTPRSDMGNSV